MQGNRRCACCDNNFFHMFGELLSMARSLGASGLSRRSRCLALTLALALAAAFPVVGAQASGRGSVNYANTFLSSVPYNYRPAPASWPQGSSILYDFRVQNLDIGYQLPTAEIYTQRVHKVNGQQVTASSPDLQETQVLNGSVSGDPVNDLGPIQRVALLPDGFHLYHEDIPTADLAGCDGYLIIWIGGSVDRRDAAKVMNEGATRLRGCGASTSQRSLAPEPLPPMLQAVTPQYGGSSPVDSSPVALLGTESAANPARGIGFTGVSVAIVVSLLAAAMAWALAWPRLSSSRRLKPAERS